MKENRDSFFKYFSKEKRYSSSQQLYSDGLEAPKSYARFRQIMLPKPEPVDTSFAEVLGKRVSASTFINRPLSAGELGSLLYLSMGVKQDNQRRQYPSAGALYPIECYPLVLKRGEIEVGAYHYHPGNHALEEVVSHEHFDPYVMKEVSKYSFPTESAVVLLLSFIKQRSFPKYGSLAYKVGLLEAGHIGQNFYLAAAMLGLGARSIAAQEDAPLLKLLRLDGVNESLCYALAVGHEQDD